MAADPASFLDDSGAFRCTRCGCCCKIGLLSGPVRRALSVDHLLGEDGWCRHYDHTLAGCTIYADRPRACRDVAAPARIRAAACAATTDRFWQHATAPATAPVPSLSKETAQCQPPRRP